MNTKAFLEFLVHGLRVVFPVQPGGIARGIPTAWSTAPLAKAFPDASPVVWASENGTLRGESIAPLYRSAAQAAANSASFHELLALTDALRIGRAREVNLATQHLQRKFDGYALLAEH